MSLASVDAWAAALWRHFLPIVASGAPFYLAADRQLIAGLYRNELRALGGADDAVRAFHAGCSTLVDTSGARTSVREHTFQRLPGHAHSRAICLAVQQVLVVESMLHDGVYSERAYFPRYREALGVADGNERSSPIPTSIFARIWETLSAELTAVDGATERSVTFAPGHGPHRNRQFPLSQALLTTHDLTILRDEARGLPLDADDTSVLRALLQVRVHLGVRARRLIAAAATDRVVSSRLGVQVRAFLASETLGSLRRVSAAPPDGGRIVGYLERTDEFAFETDGDTYAIYRRTSSEHQDGEHLDAALRDRLTRGDAVVLVPEADGFSEWNDDFALESAEAVLAIVLTSKAEDFVAQVKDAAGGTFVAVRSNLSNRFAVLVCTAPDGFKLAAALGASERGVGKALELEGGLMADARSHTFLMGYAPTDLRHEGRLLAADDMIVVDGESRQLGEWLRGLALLSAPSSFRVQVDRNVFNMSVAARRLGEMPAPEIGFVLSEDELALTPRRLDVGEGSLRGTQFSEPRRRREVTLSKRDVLKLIERGKRFALPASTLAMVLAELRGLGREEAVAVLAAQQVAATRSVPLAAVTTGLVRRLEAAYAKREPPVG